MTTSLMQLQNELQAYILENEAQVEKEIIPPANSSAKIRLDVYREGYYLRLIEILALDFPNIKKLLGDTAFDKLSRAYIDAYPSNQFSVRTFGRHFEKFLSNRPDCEPVLPEIAKFEWAIAEVQDEADAVPLTIEEMAKIPPEAWAGMRFSLHPSVQVLSFFYNAPEIWRAIDSNEKPPEAQHQDTPKYWLVWRFEFLSYFNSLTEQESHMFKAIQAGKAFAEICEDLCQWFEDEEVVQFAAGVLRTWVSEGLFSAVNYEISVATSFPEGVSETTSTVA